MTTWPCVERLGLPLDPHQSKWHWVAVAQNADPMPCWWDSMSQTWQTLHQGPVSISDVTEAGGFYLGPCQTPEMIARQISEAVLMERRRCADMIDCGCPHAADVVAVVATQGHNCAARWRICGEPRCGAIDAWEMRDHSPGRP